MGAAVKSGIQSPRLQRRQVDDRQDGAQHASFKRTRTVIEPDRILGLAHAQDGDWIKGSFTSGRAGRRARTRLGWRTAANLPKKADRAFTIVVIRAEAAVVGALSANNGRVNRGDRNENCDCASVRDLLFLRGVA
jgi:hypothetical protein